MKVVTIPVGQGDSTLIECPGPNGDMTLIDMGSDHFALSRKTYIKEVLDHTDNGARLKYIFLTHPDKDHISHGLDLNEGDNVDHEGLITKIKAAKADSSIEVYLGKKDGWTTEGSQSAKDLINMFKGRSVQQRLHYYQAPKDVSICGPNSHVKLRIIASDLGNTANSRSMILKLINGQTNMLFLGDLEDGQSPKKEVIQKLIDDNTNELEADVIMIPHHGSNNNGNGKQNLYEAVKARSAIISSHIMKGHDHPKLETIESFCHGETINVCDIPCGYQYKGHRYHTQSDLITLPNGMNAAICPSGDVTTWAPFKTVNPDLSGSEEYGSRNTPHQTWTCYGKKILQTTKLVEDEDRGVKVQAYIIGTYLGPEAKQVRHTQFRLNPASDEKHFEPPTGKNMFDMI